MYSIKDTQIDSNTKIDLSGYATVKTTDKLTVDVTKLQTSVANKLDSNPVDHEHTISQITQLQETLNNKLNIPSTEANKYSYNTLLKDWQSIPYLENVKIPTLDISPDKNSSGYIFSVDSTGDLMITLNNVVIAFYYKTAGTWNLNGINEVLKNHYEALLIILDKLGMTDGDTTDGNKVTPTEEQA